MDLKLKRYWIYLLLISFLLLDFAYSFYQHYHLPIGGDIAQIVLPSPSKGYYGVLQDPLGLQVLKDGHRYSNPNRFFSHWIASNYFLQMPTFLQHFTSPISSVYLSISLFKMLLHTALIYLLSFLICNRINPLHFDFLLAAFIITPLFQTVGFNRFIGIIDQSVIYNFFYALPCCLLLVLIMPYFRWIYHGIKFRGSIANMMAALILAVILSLSGPLIPGIVLIIFILVLYKLFEFRSPRGLLRIQDSGIRLIPHFGLLIWIVLLSIYSLYLGQFNALNTTDSLDLLGRYIRIPLGLYELVSTKIGLPLILLCTTINVLLIKRYFSNRGGTKIMQVAKWILFFSLIYILLLPLGGYRIYRPNIIRYDTMIPITICLIFIYGLSTFFLIKESQAKFRNYYLFLVLGMAVIFTNADKSNIDQYSCEKDALNILSKSNENRVKLPNDCPVMEFRIVSDPQHSDLKVNLLKHWNIIDRDLLFYQDGGE